MPPRDTLPQEWDLLSPQEKESLMRAWGDRQYPRQLPPLSQEQLSLSRAGVPTALPSAPPSAAGALPLDLPGISQTFPEWQEEAYGMLGRIKPGMRRYQPPEGVVAADKERGALPKLDIYPWVVTRAEEAARVGRGVPAAAAPEKPVPTKPVPTKGERYQRAVRETAKFKAELARESLSIGGKKSIKEMSPSQLKTLEGMLTAQWSTIQAKGWREKPWKDFFKNIPADLAIAKDIQEALLRVKQATRAATYRLPGGGVREQTEGGGIKLPGE